MNEITTFCQSFKKDFIPRTQDPRQPVRCWSEKDSYKGKIVDAYVIILRTRGCSWALTSGCTMCGYFNDSMFTTISEKDLQEQFKKAMQNYKGEKIVKLFTSGSFFDSNEIPVNTQKEILQTLATQAEKISVESRPQYITEKRLTTIEKNLSSKEFEIGIGLETSSDRIREKAINKGFTFHEYKKTIMLLKKHSMKIKTYVLMKPPFLTEREAFNDCIKTTKDIESLTDIISLNPVNVQHHTIVEYLWKRNQYRPPWLWTIVKYLQQSKSITNAFVKCDVVGGGSIRGAHNCGKCDHIVLNAIKNFSLTQKQNIFLNLSCDCKEKWYDQLVLENLSFGSIVDCSRWSP